MAEKREQPGEQEYTGGDHGGRMQEGADRGRALHGIGQPCQQGELGALADDTAEYQHGTDRGEPVRQATRKIAAVEEQQIQISQVYPEQKDTDKK